MILSVNPSETIRFARSENNRVFSGVAGGLAARVGVDAIFVRLALILLTVNFGVGILVYFALHAVASEDIDDVGSRPITDRHNLGLALLVLAILCGLRAAGVWIGDAVMIPAILVAAGSTAILVRKGRDSIRVGAGSAAVSTGVGVFLAEHNTATGDGRTLLAVAATIIGMALIFGPWTLRLARQAMEERRSAVRNQERAEMGAHLHDSVLQTLAMIQRADSPDRMVQLARQQERDLRSWLHGRPQDENATVESTLEALADRIDSDFQVVVNVVVVGDTTLTEELRPLVAATQEAVTNAARHSGATAIHVFVEIGAAKATSLVRDEGNGFDLDAIDDDRQGIRESIRGRMQRHGGDAKIISTIGSGTEVELSLPLHQKERS